MNTTVSTLLILRGLTVIAGSIFLVIVGQAYRSQHSRSMLWLAGAIALMVLGAFVELVAFLLLGSTLGQAEVLEASVMLLAFVVLLVAVRKQTA